jgi:transaldolase
MDDRGTKRAMSSLLELARFGQSYWIDDLSRPMIKSGELHRRVTKEGLTGVTVNPAIFRAAVHASDAYDRQIEELAAQPANSIYEALLVTDVRMPAMSCALCTIAPTDATGS